MDERDAEFEAWLDSLADETERCGYAQAKLRAWEEEQSRLAAVPAPVDAGGEIIPF